MEGIVNSGADIVNGRSFKEVAAIVQEGFPTIRQGSKDVWVRSSDVHSGWVYEFGVSFGTIPCMCTPNLYQDYTHDDLLLSVGVITGDYTYHPMVRLHEEVAKPRTVPQWWQFTRHHCGSVLCWGSR